MRAAPDVVVVGAGIFGAATACFLAQRRLNVLVLERREIASGATGWTSRWRDEPGPG